MVQQGGNTIPRITRAEHIGPNDTGDNIEAKRVAPYYFDGNAWQRQPFAPGSMITQAFDYIGITYPTTTTEVYAFKTGGSGGTTVNTLTLTYTDDTKESLSSVERT